MTSNDSSKAVYNAVPLLQPLLEPQEPATSELETTTQDEPTITTQQQQASSSNTLSANLKPFGFGMTIGSLCYVLVDSKVVPSLHFEHILVNSLVTALLWSTITSAVAYGIFWSTWVLCSSRDEEDEIEEDDEDTPQALVADSSDNNTTTQFFEQMEYYFTLGVFLGFCAACTIDVILFGIPLFGILSMVLVAILWTLVMLKVAPPNGVGAKQRGTALPMVIV